MRFIANENFPYDAVTALRERGHDVVWVRTDAPGSSDEDVLKRARTEERILLTLPSSSYVAHLVVATVESRADWAGYFAVVEEHRIRIRTLLDLK